MATSRLPDQQQQPAIYPQAASSGDYHSSGSVGPFFAVLAVITVLTALSCVLGRVCARQAGGLDSRYDCLEWMRRRRRHFGAVDVENRHKAADNVEVTNKPQENEQPQPQPTAAWLVGFLSLPGHIFAPLCFFLA